MALPALGDVVRVYNDNGHQDGTVYELDDFSFHMKIEEDTFTEDNIDENIACDTRVVKWELLYASG
jgi:hypothetical protein